jgi:hypothetical protein
MSARSTKVGLADQPELRFSYDPKVAVDPDADHFVGVLERMIKSGSRFAPGQVVQVGWGVLRVEQSADGGLDLREPDFRSMPIQWVDGISRTLRYTRIQRDVVASVLPVDALALPSLRDSCLVCDRLRGAGEILMSRGKHGGSDSGWFMGCGSPDHDRPEALKRISLYEAMASYSDVPVPYLGLPQGTIVAIRGRTPQIFLNKKELKPKEGSLLWAALKG